MNKTVGCKNGQTHHKGYRQKCTDCRFVNANPWRNQADDETADKKADKAKDALEHKMKAM